MRCSGTPLPRSLACSLWWASAAFLCSRACSWFFHGPAAARLPQDLASIAARDVAGAQHRVDNLIGRSSPSWGIRWSDLPESITPLRLFVVCRHLVRRLCAACSSDGDPHGCEERRHGYSGFAALAETVEFEANSTADLLVEDYSTHETYRPFTEHAAALVTNKVTTLDETRRALGPQNS